jgi:hypothetical protein
VPKNLAFTLVGDLLISIWGDAPPSEERFLDAMAFYERAAAIRNRHLVITLGSGPNAAQRQQLSTLPKQDIVAVAVVCHVASADVRRVISALGWFNPGIKAFPAEGLEDALEYLDVPPESVLGIALEVEALLGAVAAP